MAYVAYLTRLTDVKKDLNSANLYTATCMGEQVIVSGDMVEGEKVLYFPAGVQINQHYATELKLLRKDKDGNPLGGYLDPNCHVKALTLRGLRSEGIAFPFYKIPASYNLKFQEDEPVETINRNPLCWKYMPPQTYSQTPKTSQKGKKAGKITFPDFAMHEDTEQLRHNIKSFKPGELYQISLKLHGSSQRSAYSKAILPKGFFRRLFHLPAKTEYRYICGTRRVALSSWDTGYYGNDEFRRQHHERLIPHLEKGMEVFYEVVGYVNSATPIMPSASNKKLGKDFIKQYGEETKFTYGCLPGESKMFIYRITTADGECEWTPLQIIEWCTLYGFDYVPYLECEYNPDACSMGYFTFTTVEDLLARVNACNDGPDPIGQSHIREGVVVRKVKGPFKAWKDKNMSFKILSGLTSEAVASGETIVDDSLLDEI